MECELLNEQFEEVARGSGLTRTPDFQDGKIHLTTVIKSIQGALGTAYSGKGFDDMVLTMEIGFWWEDMLSRVMGSRMGVRLEEVELDGILASPDGIGEDPLGEVPMVLEEYKFTWKSDKNLPTENWAWMTQTKSYCRMLDTSVVVMRIAYIMGNYRGSGPRYKAYRIQFTEEELWQNWEMVVKHAEEMREKALEVD